MTNAAKRIERLYVGATYADFYADPLSSLAKQVACIYEELIDEGEHETANQLMNLGWWRVVETLHSDELKPDEMASAILSMQCPKAVRS